MAGELTSAIIGAASSTVVGLAIYAGQQRQTKWQTTISLIREFNSFDFMVMRRKAYDCLNSNPSPQLLTDRDSVKPALSAEERDMVWAIITFFAGLSTMVEAGLLYGRPVYQDCGEVFGWWWGFWLEHADGLTHLSEKKRIDWLSRWFLRRAAQFARSGEYELWVERGRHDRRLAMARREQTTN